MSIPLLRLLMSDLRVFQVKHPRQFGSEPISEPRGAASDLGFDGGGCPLVTSIATKIGLLKGLQGGDFRDS